MNDQIAAIRANSNLFASTAIRGVQGGFVVSGQLQYQDKDTKGIVLTENAEGVASSPESAAQMSLNYLRSGNFEGAAQAAAPTQDGPQNMFSSPALGTNTAATSGPSSI